MFEPLPNYYKVIEEIEREKQMEDLKEKTRQIQIQELAKQKEIDIEIKKLQLKYKKSPKKLIS